MTQLPIRDTGGLLRDAAETLTPWHGKMHDPDDGLDRDRWVRKCIDVRCLGQSPFAFSRTEGVDVRHEPGCAVAEFFRRAALSQGAAHESRSMTLREAALTLCHFAGRFSAGDTDVQRDDLQAAIDDVRAALSLTDTGGLREAAEEVVRRASTKPSHRPATARSYEGWVRGSLEALRAALSQGAAHREPKRVSPDRLVEIVTERYAAKLRAAGWTQGAAHEERGLDAFAVQRGDEDWLHPTAPWSGLGLCGASDERPGYGCILPNGHDNDPGTPHAKWHRSALAARLAATPEAAPEPVEHSWRFTAENAAAAVRYRHETATPEAAPRLTRATAKGTNISVDEWGRPLYVFATPEAAPLSKDDIGVLADARAVALADGPTPEAAPEEGTCHGKSDARHLCVVHEGGWLDGTASNRRCTIARAATPTPTTEE